VHRYGWLALPWQKLLPRVVLGALFLGTFHSLPFWIVTNWKYSEMITPLGRWLLLAGMLAWASVVFLAWSALYFGYHFYQNWQRGQLDYLRLQTAAKEAELRALRAQVNPHFLFNSLNTLRWLIDENPTRAREAVTHLAQMFRSSLQSSHLSLISLQQELEAVEACLALEKNRHEDRLVARNEIAPDTLQAQLPPFILQTLIENALKHGIAHRPDGGEVVYGSRREGDTLKVWVKNSGRLSPEDSSSGTGLHNSRERLRLLFGEKARLQLSAPSPETVLAELELPFTTLSTPAFPIAP
jgi:LytS/YehU family sensor histidine kinase